MTHMEAPGSRPRRSRTRKPRDHARGGCAHGSPGIAPGGFYDAHGSPGITPAAVTHMAAPRASEGITRRKPRTRHFTARLLPDRASRGGSRVRDTLPPACCLIGHHGMPTMQAAILSHPRDTALAAEIPLKPATAFFSRGRLPGLGCGSVRPLRPTNVNLHSARPLLHGVSAGNPTQQGRGGSRFRRSGGARFLLTQEA